MRKVKKALIVFTLLSVFAAEIFLLIRYGHGEWNAKLGLVLAIIGAYSLALGFVRQSAIGKTFSELIESMTSTNPLLFISGNFHFMGMFFQLTALGMDSKRAPGGSVSLGCLGFVLLVFATPVILIYSFVHLVLILPIAYIGYLLSSAIVEAVGGASRDVEVTQAGDDNDVRTLSLKNVVNADRQASKSFLLGIPAIATSFVLQIISVFNPG